MLRLIENWFKLEEHGTTVKTEVLAGITTFTTMSYIIFVNPQIVSQSGMDFGAVMAATILTGCIATLWMGLFANYPFVVASGMSLNAFFTYTLVLGEGHSWQVALGCCFIAGLILGILNLLNIRERIMNTIPPSLRLSVSGGIGIFLAFVGIKNIGLVVANKNTLIGLGYLKDPVIMLSLGGLILTGALLARRIRGAILLGILAIWLGALAWGLAEWKGFFSLPASLAPTFLQMDLLGALDPETFGATLSLTFVTLFNATGALIALASQGQFLDERGHLPRAKAALYPDAWGTSIGAILGTTPLTNFLDSGAGIAEGGRTGLTSVVTAILLLLTLFITPLAESIPLFATAPVLIIIGSLMVRPVMHIRWEDITEAIPAFLTLITIPLTYSIGDGIAIGFIVYPLLKMCSGRIKEVHWIVWVIAILFLAKLLFA